MPLSVPLQPEMQGQARGGFAKRLARSVTGRASPSLSLPLSSRGRRLVSPTPKGPLSLSSRSRPFLFLSDFRDFFLSFFSLRVERLFVRSFWVFSLAALRSGEDDLSDPVSDLLSRSASSGSQSTSETRSFSGSSPPLSKG